MGSTDDLRGSPDNTFGIFPSINYPLGQVKPEKLTIYDTPIANRLSSLSYGYLGFEHVEETLQDLGYFVQRAPYDWRLTIDKSAGQYLKVWIDTAKSKCNSSKV